MTDEQTPEQPGKPPVGGPLRPDQLPPGYPDPNAPKLVFGPGRPQANPPQQQTPQQQAGPQRPQQQQGSPQQPFQPPQQYRAPQPFPQGQPQPFRQGQPQQFGPGRPQQAGPGQPQQLAPGQSLPGRPPLRGPAGQGQPQWPGHPGGAQPGGAQVPFRPGPEYGNQTGQQPFAPPAAPKAKRKPLGRKLWIGVVVGAVAASLIAVPLTLLSVGRLFTPMLDTGSVQSGVAQVLKDDFGLADVEQVECPAGQAAVTGTRFECTFSYNTKSYPVAVEVINDQGQYRVGIDAPK